MASFLFDEVSTLLAAGLHGSLSEAHLLPLAAADGADQNGARARSEFELERRARSGRILLPLFRTQPGLLARLLCAKIAAHLLGLAQPLLLRQLLAFQESQGSELGSQAAQASSGLLLGFFSAGSMLLLRAGQIVVSTQLGFWIARAKLRLNAALSSEVCRAAVLHGAPHSANKGCLTGDEAVYSLLCLDVACVVDTMFLVMDAWLWPFTFLTTCYVVSHQLGAAFVPGLAAVLSLMGVNLILQWRLGVLRRSWMSAKDERLALCSAAFGDVRTLQLLNWDVAISDRIGMARSKELSFLAWMEGMSFTSQGVGYISSYLVALVTFFTYVRSDGILRASVLMPALDLLGSLKGQIDRIPDWLREWLVYCNAAERIAEYLRLRQCEASSGLDVNVGEADLLARGPRLTSCRRRASPDGRVVGRQMTGIEMEMQPLVERRAFAARAQGPRGVSCPGGCSWFQLPVQGILVVTGPSGSGKSRLLRSVIDAYAATHEAATPLSFCPQDAWLRGCSVRENVLFGTRLHEPAYSATLEACALATEIAAMPSGDLTRVDVNTVSGGQRRRLALARAVYRCAPGIGVDTPLLCILDDPLASLDVETAACIVARLFGEGGLLASVPVVVCSQSTSFLDYMPLGKEVSLVHLKDGEQVGEPQRWRQSAARRQTFPVAAAPSADLQCRYADVAAEDHVSGAVRWATYTLYGRLVGWGCVWGLVLSIAGIMGSQQCVDLWVSYWMDDDKPAHFLHALVSGENRLGIRFPIVDPDAVETSGLGLYAALVAVFTLFNFSGFWIEVVGGVRAAGRLFRRALRGVIVHHDFAWWDRNTSGRVLNRFAGDVQVVDETITRMMGVIVGASFFFIGHTLFLAVVNPWTLVVLPFVLLGYEAVARRFRKSIRELHRYVLERQSPIFESLSEALRGRDVLRAFAQQYTTCGGLCRAIDAANEASLTKLFVRFWLTLRLESLGFILQAVSTLSPVLQTAGLLRPQSASLVGFAVSYSSGLAGVLGQLVNNFSDLEMQLISVERLAMFAECDSLPMPVESLNRPAGEELRGELHFQQVAVRYGSGLAPVLRGVTLRLAAGTRTAVVGPTGAGKSSLLLALLRALPFDGEILLDCEPMSRLGARGARERLSIVPQQPMLFAGTLRENLDLPSCAGEQALGSMLAAILPDLLGRLGVASLDARVAALGANGEAVLESELVLSFGEAQAVCLARAALRRPSVLILDEVTAGLAEDAAGRLVDAARSATGRASCLFATHDLPALRRFGAGAVISVQSGTAELRAGLD